MKTKTQQLLAKPEAEFMPKANVTLRVDNIAVKITRDLLTKLGAKVVRLQTPVYHPGRGRTEDVLDILLTSTKCKGTVKFLRFDV